MSVFFLFSFPIFSYTQINVCVFLFHILVSLSLRNIDIQAERKKWTPHLEMTRVLFLVWTDLFYFKYFMLLLHVICTHDQINFFIWIIILNLM